MKFCKHRNEMLKYTDGQFITRKVLMTVSEFTFGLSKFASTTFGRASTLDFKSFGMLRMNRSFSSPSFTLVLLSGPFVPKMDST